VKRMLLYEIILMRLVAPLWTGMWWTTALPPVCTACLAGRAGTRW